MKLKFANALSLALIMAMLFTSVGLADTISSDADIVAVGNNPSQNLGTVAPGATLSPEVSFQLVCNGNKHVDLNQTVSLQFNLGGSTVPGGSLSATSASIGTIPLAWPDDATGPDNCGGALPLNDNGNSTVTIVAPTVAGTYTYVVKYSVGISPSQSDDPNDVTGSAPTASFTLTVSAPANTPPNVSVTGVSNGATYSKGSVPVAGCSVIDAEDGNSTPAATLSSITGPYASDGIGSQAASCSYTDAGGLTANASATYSIVDSSAPSISYVLTPSSPDGSNGWYKSNVTLVWTVSESESPSSLAKTGCVDQNITADQAATTYSCSASSAGGTATQVNVTIKRDATAPVITFDSPSISSWYNADVTANWSCLDALSGAVSASVSALASGEGSAVPATGTCTDNAGNSANDTQNFKIDKTGPSIVANATKADASAYTADTWTNQDVTVDFTCDDTASGLASCTGDASYNTEGTFTASGTATDNVGNSSNASFGPIKIDKTAPTITGAPTTPANAYGWYNGDVTIHWTCSDALSGLSGSCPADSVINGEGNNLSASASVSDLAGNSASATVSGINIDRTAPTASASALPAANANGWNNTNVTVSFSGTDGLSGIAACDAAVVLNAEGAGQSASGTCTDKAGNVSAPATASGINIDRTAPTASASVSPAANSNGWNNTNVTVSFSGSDALSGIDSCDAAVVLNAEGAGQSASGDCTDKAGNVSSPATASGINIDKTNPTVSLVGGPADGGTYYFGFVPAAPTCSASDALSGLDGSCTVSGYGNAIGAHTVTAGASDKAGNSASASASYTVLGWTINGFYQPVDMGKLNIAKNGSTVPLKFEVFAGPTELTNTNIILGTFVQKLTCGTGVVTDDIENYSTGGTSLRYDTTGGQFIFNWQTPKLAGNCYKVTLTTADGSSISADFKLK